MAGIPDTRKKGQSLEAPSFETPKEELPKLKETQSSAVDRLKDAVAANSPYEAWMKVRLVTTSIGALLGWLLFYWITDSWFLGILVGLIIFLPSFRNQDWEKRGLLLDAIDDWLAEYLPPRECPDCGQSIFDKSEPSSYAAETEAQAFFPAKECHNCGRDLTEAAIAE